MLDVLGLNLSVQKRRGKTKVEIEEGNFQTPWIGNSNCAFGKVRELIEKKVRRFVAKRKGLKGFGWKRWSREEIYRNGGYTTNTKYDISTRKQLQADRCIGFVEKRTGKPYEGKPHVRFDVAGDGKVPWRA